MLKLIIFSAITMFCVIVESKPFNRCELIRELRVQGFPEDKLRDWICLIEAESSRDPEKISKENKNGSRDHGLFQINDKHWCKNSNTTGNDCNVTCNEVTVNLTKASKCAKMIFKRHGFKAWYGWRNKCEGKPLPDISSC